MYMMRAIDQLAYHLFQTLGTYVVVYQEDHMTSEFPMNGLPIELKTYLETQLQIFYEASKHNHHLIVVQKIKESDMCFASFLCDDVQVILGPFLENECSIHIINYMKLSLRLDAHRTDMLNQFYESLRILQPNDLRFIYQLVLSYVGYTNQLEISYLKPMTTFNIQQEHQIEDLNANRMYVKRNYQLEDQLMRCIKDGDLIRLKEVMSTMSTFFMPDRAPRDTLRNTKNKMIILNTLSTRHAIEGGLDIYHAHELSTALGIKIELMKSNADQDNISQSILMTFTEAVKEYRTKDYPVLIKNAMIYIYRHLKAPLTVKDIADENFVSVEHLSRYFKKYVGKTIQRTIIDYKILEAKKLIAQNELSLIDISEMLGFSSTAHFSTTFKHVSGMTPKSYRESVLKNLK